MMSEMLDTVILQGAVSEFDDPSPETLSRPGTPTPDSCTLRRSPSCASITSIETVHPRADQGIRRCIVDIAKALTQKASKRKKEDSSTQTEDVLKAVTPEPVLPADVPAKKPKYTRKSKKVRFSEQPRSEKRGVGIHSVLLSGIPIGPHAPAPSTPLFCTSDSLFDEVPLDESLEHRGNHPTLRGACVVPESEDMEIPGFSTRPLAFTLMADSKDVKLEIRPSESDITIWDGLQASQHVFKCRLYLQCTTYPFDGIAMPAFGRVEMTCTTHPAGSRYAPSPMLLTTYKGHYGGITKDGSLRVDLETGIQISAYWRTVLDNKDGTWGWYKEVSVPLSPRLFDKMEYREFKLASKMRVGRGNVEGELTFGISMLLRGVDMI